MVEIGQLALERAGVAIEEVGLVVPHQANIRIIEYAGKKLGIDMKRMVVTINRHGNTSSASIPLAFVEAINAGRVERGDKILLVGFGAGMTAAAAVIEW
jgi:3-oxoacyl-[acyl-carrier-protein] synthase-3